MDTREDLETRRQEILQEMCGIRRMRRGTVNEQFVRTRRRDGTVVENGPYYLYSRTEKGQSFSQRIPAVDAERFRQETEACRRFKELAMQCVLVCESLAEREPDLEGKKKRPRPRRSGSGR